MYAHFRGKIDSINPTAVVLDCAGVGYELHISLYTYEQIKALPEVKLFAHLAIKEDAHTLYGFVDESERSLFRHLISVQGIGAATARMVLSSLDAIELRNAISLGNVALLKSVKGVGPKSAQRIVLELQDKMQKEDLESGFAATARSGSNALQSEAVAALEMLGFSKRAVEKEIQKILDTSQGDDLTVEQIIKVALKKL